MNDLLLDTDNREAIQTGYPKPTLTRRNTGYALDMMLDTGQPFNFCKLLAGSEGTLGILTEAKLNLNPWPPAEVGMLCHHRSPLTKSRNANIVSLRHIPED